MPKVWTRKELRVLADRRMSGESTASIAASVGTTANNLRHRWRKHIGFRTRELQDRTVSVAKRTVSVWGWLRAGETLSACCRRLGWPSDQKHLNRLSMALRRFCARNMIPLPAEVKHGRKAAEQAHPHAG